MKFFQKSEDPSTLLNQGSGPDLNCADPFQRVIEPLPEQYPIPASIIKLGLLARQLEPEPERYKVDTTNLDNESTSIIAVPQQTLTRVRWLLSNYTSGLTDVEKERIGNLCSASGLNRPLETGSNDIGKINSSSQTAIDKSIFVEQSSAKVECERLIKELGSGLDDIQSATRVECEYCGGKYNSTAAFDNHLTSCEERQTAQKAEETNGQKEYICSGCNKSFKNKNALRVHKKRNCTEQSSESSSEKPPAFGKEIKKNRGSERVSGRNVFAAPKKLKDTGLHQGGG